MEQTQPGASTQSDQEPDPDLASVVSGWITTGTYQEERLHLGAHPELLAAAADEAVEQALQGLLPEAAQRYRWLRAAAREHGVDAAYRPIMVALLASHFASEPPVAQRRMLAERREELLDPAVREHLDRLTRNNADPDRSFLRAVALLDLAARRYDGAGLNALDHPDLWPDVLHAFATELKKGPSLHAMAMLAAGAAQTPAQAARAGFFLALHSAIAQDLELASALLEQARSQDGDQVTEWIAVLAEALPLHPEVAFLRDTLTTDPTPEN